MAKTISDLVEDAAARALARKQGKQYRPGRERPRAYRTSQERNERWMDRRVRYLLETGRKEQL
jgi:hypothetical protein